MNALIVLTAILAVTHALPLSESEEQQWEKFKVDYNKIYETEAEENIRKKIFFQNLKEFEEHNKKFNEGLVKHTVGINLFADITDEEFSIMFPPMNISEVTGGLPYVPPVNLEAPSSMDWRERGGVTNVKHQGGCGSCYAFTAAAVLEGHLFRQTGRLVSLSAQNLIDCTVAYGNGGCDKGFIHTCFDYVKQNRGINTEQSYPYEERVGQCRYNPQNNAGTDQGYIALPRGDENGILNIVASQGPVGVGINSADLKRYTGGIYGQPCDPNRVDHAVAVVGYGTATDGTEYWIIKNSWGAQWGEGGFGRLLRNRNQCGIANQAVYPVV